MLCRLTQQPLCCYENETSWGLRWRSRPLPCLRLADFSFVCSALERSDWRVSLMSSRHVNPVTPTADCLFAFQSSANTQITLFFGYLSILVIHRFRNKLGHLLTGWFIAPLSGRCRVRGLAGNLMHSRCSDHNVHFEVTQDAYFCKWIQMSQCKEQCPLKNVLGYKRPRSRICSYCTMCTCCCFKVYLQHTHRYYYSSYNI